MRGWILLCVASIVFVSGRHGTFVSNNKNVDMILQDVTKRVSTNAKTELWKNVAKFIDRYSPLKHGNQIVHELTMKKDVDRVFGHMLIAEFSIRGHSRIHNQSKNGNAVFVKRYLY
jgi:hypothetical protein